MKKYLMTGIAAIAMCFGFTSCSHEFDNLSQEEIDQMKANEIVENYKKAFIENFGQPAADQDWGFGTSSFTRGYSTNHNLWGDPNADGGAWNWNVPPALTDGQKLRVKLYFQYHPWLTYEDPGLTNFFVQQVYKGGTSPIASQSAEVYPTGNGGSAIGGQQMDKLTVGTPGEGGQTANYYDHVNDFNNGNYNGGSTIPVLNTGGNTNNYSTESHPDMITLMVNSKSDCVGYWSSNGATGHNDRCALANAADIDAWATSAEALALNLPSLGEAVVDGWNRSFVGLDYDGVYGDNIYKHGAMVNGSWDNNAIAYAKFSDARQKDYLWDGQRVWSFDEYIAENGEYFLDKEGNKVPYTINERNMFIGTNSDLSGQSAYITRHYIAAYGREDDCIDLTIIQAKIDEGALPCDGKLYQWTKNVGGRDHVYSDWIVTLTPATKQTTTPPPSDNYTIRVIAEDLTFGKDLNTDFDFNDVVFDVCLKATETKIRLKAAGGTLPLIIGVANPQNDQEYINNEVHHLFDVATNVMVNTNAQKKGLNSASKPDAFLTLNTTYTNAKNIPVYVKKNGIWVELTAVQGEPASKIGVGLDFQWVDERESLKGEYTEFVNWVKADANERGFKWW